VGGFGTRAAVNTGVRPREGKMSRFPDADELLPGPSGSLGHASGIPGPRLAERPEPAGV
jgi:hypothetical protein